MSWLVRGRVWKFGDDINTDVIISGKYKFKTTDMRELAKHAMESIDPEFSRRVKPGDFIVAGKNFGCGSSREQAPRVLKELGIGAVIAKSFARIFFRNAVNVGLPVLECPGLCDVVEEGEVLEVDLESGVIRRLKTGESFSFHPLPAFLLNILRDGGLVSHYKKHGGFRWRGV